MISLTHQLQTNDVFRWSQHDMGCTTLDSMVSNWEVGHQWLLSTFGESAQPKIGWSLDPFGMSGSQAVIQSLMGNAVPP